MPSSDSQPTCATCRKDLKDSGVKSPLTKKIVQNIDDSLLDDDHEPEQKSVSKVATTSNSTSQDAVLAMLADVSAGIKSLSSRMEVLESGGGTSERTVNPSTPGASSSSAATSRPPATVSTVPHESDILSDPEEGEDRSDNLQDREPDTLYVEMLQTIKMMLGIQHPECGDIQPPAAFNKKSVS